MLDSDTDESDHDRVVARKKQRNIVKYKDSQERREFKKVLNAELKGLL